MAGRFVRASKYRGYVEMDARGVAKSTCRSCFREVDEEGEQRGRLLEDRGCLTQVDTPTGAMLRQPAHLTECVGHESDQGKLSELGLRHSLNTRGQVNPQYISVNWESGGGGAFAVIPLSERGRLPEQIPLFRGHTAAVLDTDW